MNKGELVVENNQEVQLPIVVQPHMRLIELAIEKGTDITQIEKLMALQERYEANQSRKYFFDALSNFQSDLPVIEKKGVTYNGGPYAKIEDISQAIKPSLAKFGLSYRFEQEQSDKLITVTCIVSNKSGHQEKTSMTAPADTSGNKNFIQAIASTVTYLRRYTLTGGLGVIVGGEDDDAASDLVNGNQQSDCYPDEDFNKHFPNWEKAILAGKKTPDQIIANGNNQGITFSEDQLNKIHKVGNA